MLLTAHRRVSCRTASSRPIHASSVQNALKQVEKKQSVEIKRSVAPSPGSVYKSRQERYGEVEKEREREDYVKRNELGVQLLSRKLHSQIFKGVTFPAPDRRYVNLAREHLRSHGLNPTQGSVLPNIDFTLPPLQGKSIDEHFFRIGAATSQPWLDLANEFAEIDAPPKPDYWHIQPGWTKYHHREDGSGFSEHVSAPEEDVLSFDVETLPNYHPYAVMACAMSRNHWYSWVSPWLLGETDDPRQLIPLGNPKSHRIVVGHNVSYDRARVLEEYSVAGTNTRFLDTMSLHVAVKGISSHQRPAWMKYRKSKKEEQVRKEEAVEASINFIRETEEQHSEEADVVKRADLRRIQQDIEESLPQLVADDDSAAESDSKRWEDITSANSLADVAKLHCDIDISKETRNDFMTHSREQILEDVQDYMDYCATDVQVTHAVYAKVFPEFLRACPSPVSFAGIMTMGSSFLTVNEEWEEYLKNAEGIYKELDDKIKKRLVELAEQARTLMEDERWKEDVWFSQLDWTPKAPGKSRGIDPPPKLKVSILKPTSKRARFTTGHPEWFETLSMKGPLSPYVKNRILPLLLRLTCDGHPLRYTSSDGWTYEDNIGQMQKPRKTAASIHTVLGKSLGLKELRNGRMACIDIECAMAVCDGDMSEELARKIMALADDVLANEGKLANDPSISQLNWHRIEPAVPEGSEEQRESILWPKWYWELAKPKKDMPPGSLDITVRNRLSPLLLKLSWAGWPLFHSREHGWIFRVAPDAQYETRLRKLSFYDSADAHLQEAALRDGYVFYKLPHKDGEAANVGSPFGKTFVKYAQDGTLTSPGDEAKDALDMNAQCSYWISSRDRILNQMVVWENEKVALGIRASKGGKANAKWGMIIPQVITMGTVTRRAIERTWLTASNAKNNRVGSELKAMVRAPAGYAIVGADVDSEELWISSAMGDAQFGLHGATALGWMTLEGTKAAGTDLHSKTASILGISRDQAKVFNYSRIYGAGMRHAILLLLQSNPNMLPEVAQKQAEKLYASTKGKNTHRADVFERKFWFGGSESYVFNKLEEIALSDKPQTPALGCGVTHALSKEYLPPGFGTDYMTSRINWVVQSSGVDYLHLLIVAMEHLIKAYDIDARYLLSVHDELRYLVADADRHRAALALQVANLWTRCLFAYRLGMDDLPAGVAFFSAVDVDAVLRKEVDLPCVTPSQRVPIPPGEALSIGDVLARTGGGSLWRDGRAMQPADGAPGAGTPAGYVAPDCLAHRAASAGFLRAQATTEFGEIKRLAELETGQAFRGDVKRRGAGSRTGRPRRPAREYAPPAGSAINMDAEIARERATRR
ncbi:DNA polymerase family A-domain-containing protein [Phellopilus nigrolimitatus]|nr:DNA polymerase family A-domain-containing protein [Phellopilus nigrolimitatus]